MRPMQITLIYRSIQHKAQSMLNAMPTQTANAVPRMPDTHVDSHVEMALAIFISLAEVIILRIPASGYKNKS